MAEKIGIEKMKEVGKASAEAMLKAKEMVKPGAKMIDVANAAEKLLRDRGFGVGFPINLSVDQQAAHYTPSLNDDKLFGEDDMVKIDFGAERDGFLGDGAITVDLSGKNQKMIEAANGALDDALAVVKAGVKVREIGSVINKRIESMGFKPVLNLGGHGIEEHDLHAGMFIPNFDNGDDFELEEGMVIAVEPFVTTLKGKGMVADSDIVEIYSFMGEAPVRSADSRMILDEIIEKYPSEPFAVRWLSNRIDSKFRLYAAVRELLRAGALEPHPTLVEIGRGLVAQAEAEVLVQKEGCEIITRI